MKTIRTTTIWTALFACILAAAAAQAGPVVPAILHPGDHYYLTFVTQDWRDGLSANIADYNNFVQAEAAQNPALTGTDVGVQWHAVASTETVNAIDNLGLLPNTPIYLLNGFILVAAGGPEYWSGFHVGPTNLSQFLTDRSAFRATTGTQPDGTADFQSLGSGFYVTNGNPPDGGPSWVSASSAQADTPEPFYAVSSLLTVPTPEPATSWLLLIGGGVLCAAAWRRRRGAAG